MLRRLLGLAILVVCADAARADFLVFFGQDLNGNGAIRLPPAGRPLSNGARNAFLSNLTGVGTEDFESFAAAGIPAAGLNLTFPGAGSATLSPGAGGASIANIPAGTNGVGRYPTSGNQYVETTNSLNLAFGAPVAAFGFLATDVGDFNGQITLTLSGGSNQVLNVGNATVAGSEGSVLFYGIIGTTAADTFTGIQFGNTAQGSDFFGFDDMTIGSLEQVTPVPIPPSALLCVIGAGVGGFYRIRRRRAGLAA